MTASELMKVTEEAKPRLISFDVFDTLLWRPFQEPTELFAHLGQAYESVGIKIRDFTPSQLRELRRTVEVECRSRVASCEVSINDIAAQLCDRLGVSEPHRLVQAEIACEENLLFADAELFSFIDYLHERGIPYALCSDMYLSPDQVLRLVQRAAEKGGHRLPEPAIVLVSCAAGTGKASGLFDLLLKKTDLSPAEILHLGDNWQSDVEGARRKGIRAIHVKRTSRLAEKLLAAEDDYADDIDIVGHDFGLSATRKQLLAAALESQDEMDHYAYGLFVAGPIVASFGAWVLSQCIKEGWSKAFALMREGHMLTPVIRRIAESSGSKVSVDNLWVSRFTTKLAAASGAQSNSGRELIEQMDLPHIDAALLRELGLWTDALEEAWTRAGLAETDDEGAVAQRRRQFLASWFDQHPEATTHLRSKLDAVAGGMGEYFKLVGFGDKAQAVVVDLGWGGSIQRALADLIKKNASGVEMAGLYLGTDFRIRKLAASNCSYRAFLFDANNPQRSAKIAHRTPELLEQFCMPNQGSLRSFSSGGEPICFPDVISPEQVRQRSEVQRGILDFVDEWMPRFLASGGRAAEPAAFVALAERARRILSRAIDAPLEQEVRLFTSWEHDVNYGSDQKQVLLGDSELHTAILKRTKHSPYQLRMEECFWPQGAFVQLGVAFRGQGNSSRESRSNLRSRLLNVANRLLCVSYVSASFVVPRSLLRIFGEPCRHEPFPFDGENLSPVSSASHVAPSPGMEQDTPRSMWDLLPREFQKRWNALPFIHVDP